ncbi:hypothetical protein ACFU6S_03545 [Streptomyces sp. NPDC057456]|uniref:hypothetical protein n=1 Tax=Streptomyces sp. NPDC057456 TaxID=3346139 RepID=UPI0036BD3A5A
MDDRYAPPGQLTAAQTRQALGITAGALRNLVYRGRLKRAGGTERHPTYSARDVAAITATRAERAAA